MLPSEPGQMATVLVAFAVIDGNPSHTSVGKETSVHRLGATELIQPARKAAVAAITSLRERPGYAGLATFTASLLYSGL